MYKSKFIIAILFMAFAIQLQAQPPAVWRRGIVTDEFIFTKAPYPECHASTIAQTKQGLVAAWFGGTKERNPDVCIWVSRQLHGKWNKAINVANGIQNDTLRYPCWNPVLYQVPGGDLILFYKIGPKPAAWKGYYKTSKDGGTTWSAQMAMADDIIGPVKNKPVLLSNGTLLSPSGTESDGAKVHFELSSDQGKTWKLLPPLNDGKTLKALQPTVLIHKDGKLQMLCRTQNRAIYQSWSTDNGLTWTTLEKSSLPNNNSGIDAVTLKDGRHLLVYNHVLPPGKEVKGARTPLNVAISKDGITWYAACILEDSQISQYSYPSVIQASDGMVHIVYTWRRERIKHVVIDPAKLVLKEIINGEWPKVEGYTPPVAKGDAKDL
jgi:predicted neuraminidase